NPPSSASVVCYSDHRDPPLRSHSARPRRDPMPVVTLTDISIRNLKPTAGRRVTYLDKAIKGFGVRVTENGQMSFVLTYGPNRTRLKLGEVGILKLAEARLKARTILAERQLGQYQPKGQVTYETALEGFLEASRAKNRPRTAKDYTRL